jgi:hypothetical protein
MEQGRSAPPASAAYLGAQFVKQTWINTKRNKISYGLGVCSVFIVVVVVALLVTVLSKSPLIFLRLAELNNGETDVKISAGTFTGWNRLNYTLVKTLIADDPSMKYHSGRIQGSAYFLPFRFCPGAPDVFEPAWKYEPLRGANDSCNAKPATCLYEYCYRPKGFNVRIYSNCLRFKKSVKWFRGKSSKFQYSFLSSFGKGLIMTLLFDAGFFLFCIDKNVHFR